MSLRPSSLPKLQLCPKYESHEDAGEAAARGTRLDAVFREVVANGFITTEAAAKKALSDEDWPLFSNEDAEAIGWACVRALELSKGSPLEARESHLRIEWEGISGTQDLCCDDECWSADLKTGQIRSYYAQQACYALGNMDRTFTTEWTVYLLFCDEQKVKGLHYTYEGAAELVRSIRASYHDEAAVPKANEYCSWCRHRFSCPAYMRDTAWFLGLDPRTTNLKDVADDPERLSQALALCYEIGREGGVLDELKGMAMEKLLTGIPVPGWGIMSGKETKQVSALMLQHHFPIGDPKDKKESKSILEIIGTQATFAALGNVKVDTFKALWAQAFGTDQFPEGVIQVRHGAAYVKKKPTKKK